MSIKKMMFQQQNATSHNNLKQTATKQKTSIITIEV